MSETPSAPKPVTTGNKGPTMQPTSSQHSVLAHTLIVIVLVGFSGTGMLTGKLHPYVFIAIGALSVGWLPPAVFLNVILRIMQENARAWLSPPPGSTSTTISAESFGGGAINVNATPAEAPATPAAPGADPDVTARRSVLPPPGVVGLLAFVATLSHLAKSHEGAVRHSVESLVHVMPYVGAFVIVVACAAVGCSS